MLQVIKMASLGIIGVILASGYAWAADVSSSMLTIEKFSAERGDAQSQYFMGEHHEYGDSGIVKNTRQALEWYRKAAAQGHAAAQFKIAEFYEKGLGGVAKDPVQAKSWLEKAAASGSLAARNRLEQQDVEEKAALEKKRQDEKKRQAALERERQAKKQAALVAKAAADERALKLAAARKKQQAEMKKPVYKVPELIDSVIGSKWYAGSRGAEFLPTIDMSCVKSKPEEATCFSGERMRIIAGAELLFSVKATLNRFNSDGKFNVAYEYHVLEKRDSTQSGVDRDMYGLKSNEGWQPRQIANCQMDGKSSIDCSFGQGQKTKFSSQ